MKYQVRGTTVTLRGDPSLARSKISLKAMMRLLQKERGGMLIEFNQAGLVEATTETEQLNFLQEVLAE